MQPDSFYQHARLQAKHAAITTPDARMISCRDLSRRVNRVSDAPRAAAIGVGVTLPYSPTGKLLRRVLRDEAAADQATTARL